MFVWLPGHQRCQKVTSLLGHIDRLSCRLRSDTAACGLLRGTSLFSRAVARFWSDTVKQTPLSIQTVLFQLLKVTLSLSFFSSTISVPFFSPPKIETLLIWGSEQRVWPLITMAAIQIIQMLALLPPLVCPTGQRRVFSIPREWCQRGPLKTAALRSEMNAPAEHNGPNLNTMRIYARSEPQQKTEDSSAPIQPSSYFISCKFATFIHTFCGFLSVYRVWNAWMTLPGVTPVWMWGFFLPVCDWNVVFASGCRSTRTGPTTTLPSQDTSAWSRTYKPTSQTECCWLKSSRSSVRKPFTHIRGQPVVVFYMNRTTGYLITFTLWQLFA